MTRWPPALASVPAALLALPAAAQDRPLVQPSRDVVVTYRVEGAAAQLVPQLVPGGAPGTLRLSWDAAGQRLRAEAEGRTQALLVDTRSRAARLMDTSLRTAFTLPVRGRDMQPLSLEGARLTRSGAETVAGLACTAYAAQSSRGEGTVCLTADGVALRGTGEVDRKQGSFTAITVAYGPLPAALFQVPRGYMQLNMPNAGRLLQ